MNPNQHETKLSLDKNEVLKIELQLKEREVWTRVACAVASANDCKTPGTSIHWANKITDAYVERFGKS